jgi:excisionase family DNA binding protein
MTLRTRKFAARGMTTRTQRPSERDTEAAAFRYVLRGRHHHNDRIKFFTIAEVAESLRVSSRTIRRRIRAGDLVVHRIGDLVRIAERDLRAFLAMHREG